MTTTEGGMVLTNDAEIARKLRMIRHQGMSEQYRHEIVGYNFRMTDPCAAIGLVQLGRLTEWTRKRNENARFYDAGLRGVRVPHVPAGREHVYHQYTVRVDPARRDAVVARLNERGVGVRVYYPAAIHEQPVFAKRPEYAQVSLPETTRALREVMSLPVHPAVEPDELAYVVAEVNAAC
jgi:dTDP-4-amino-4,6-dideoxygalactose transaminase